MHRLKLINRRLIHQSSDSMLDADPIENFFSRVRGFKKIEGLIFDIRCDVCRLRPGLVYIIYHSFIIHDYFVWIIY